MVPHRQNVKSLDEFNEDKRRVTFEDPAPVDADEYLQELAVLA